MSSDDSISRRTTWAVSGSSPSTRDPWGPSGEDGWNPAAGDLWVLYFALRIDTDSLVLRLHGRRREAVSGAAIMAESQMSCEGLTQWPQRAAPQCFSDPNGSSPTIARPWSSWPTVLGLRVGRAGRWGGPRALMSSIPLASRSPQFEPQTRERYLQE
jgi:hypothetical protein